MQQPYLQIRDFETFDISDRILFNWQSIVRETPVKSVRRTYHKVHRLHNLHDFGQCFSESDALVISHLQVFSIKNYLRIVKMFIVKCCLQVLLEHPRPKDFNLVFILVLFLGFAPGQVMFFGYYSLVLLVPAEFSPTILILFLSNNRRTFGI